MHGDKLFATALLSVPASIITGIAMFITIPLFFEVLNRVMRIINH